MLILLADDHALVREGLKNTLTGLSSDAKFVEASNAQEVLECVSGDTPFDLVLLDLVMPGNEGFQLLGELCNTYPELRIAILSGSGDPQQMRKSLDMGAVGFISKSASPEVLLSALHLILAGGIYVPPDMLKLTAPAAPKDKGPHPDQDGQQLVLTARQREVLERLEQGKSNKQIARELNLSENTIKIHVAAILRTLDVDNRTQAAMWARENA